MTVTQSENGIVTRTKMKETIVRIIAQTPGPSGSAERKKHQLVHGLFFSRTFLNNFSGTLSPNDRATTITKNYFSRTFFPIDRAATKTKNRFSRTFSPLEGAAMIMLLIMLQCFRNKKSELERELSGIL